MHLTIYAVGDIMPGEHHLTYPFGVKKVIEDKGVDYLFLNVKEILKNGDIVFGNLEAPILDESFWEGHKSNFFRASSKVVEGLKDANFKILSIANNHIMEHGKEGFLSTVNVLRDNGITPVGLKNEIEIIEKEGLKLSVMAYSFIEDFADNHLYNKVNTEKKIIVDIERVRKKVDLILLSLHWGNEFIPFPSPNQVKIGRKLIDAGADIILGTHSHVVQSYEIYDNKPIIYSLGNFIFDQTYIKRTRRSIIAKIIVNKETRESMVNIIPINLDPREYYPKVANEYEGKKILKFIRSVRAKIENKSLSHYLSTIGVYSKLAKKYSMRSKIDMRFHLLKSLPRYPIGHSIYLVKNYLQKIRRSS